MTEAQRTEGLDRRNRQRFVAMRRGEYCFWAVVDGVRSPLADLSLEGFAIAAPACPVGRDAFDFVLQRANVPDEIRGVARVANEIEKGGVRQIGCLFDSLADDGNARLQDWLIAHVIATASVPITEKDAAQIVSGPSLI